MCGLVAPTAWRQFFAACGTALALGGCMKSSHELVEVSGRVTAGNKPIAGASVNFQPIAASDKDIYPGPSSFGITDAEGRYRLHTFNENRPGAIPGRHRIVISLKEEREQDENPDRPDKRAPPRFYDGSTIVEIPPEGKDNVDFDLADPGH